MPNGQNTRKEFYDFLASSNVKMPDYETYDKALDDPAMRREFYGFLTSHQVKMPEYEVFDFSLAPQDRSAPATQQPPVVSDLEQRRSILPENLRESLAQFDIGDRQQQLEREYAQAGTTEQPGLEMTTPADAAKAGASAIVKPVEFALERVEDVVTPILAGLGKMAEGAPNAISGLAKIAVSGGKDLEASAQTLRGFGQTGLGALETVINSIPAMMVVNATVGAVGEPAQEILSKTVAGYAEAIRKNFTPEMDEKILRHVAQQYGAKAADQIVNVSVGAYFGLPVLAGMIVGEGVGSTVDNIVKDKDLKQEDKDLMVGLAHNLSFLLVAGGIQVGKKKLGEVGKYEAEAGVEGFTDVMREMSQQPTKEIKGGPGRRVGPFGFERPAEPVAPAPVVPPTTAPASPMGQFVLNQLEKSIDAAIQKGERFPVGQLLSKEVANLVEPSPSLKARFEGLAAKVEEHNKALPEGRKIPEVPGQTVTPLDKPIPAIEEGKPTAIPEFKTADEARVFGQQNTSKAKEIEPLLIARREEAAAAFQKAKEANDEPAMRKAAIQDQMASEALQYLRNPKLETPIEELKHKEAEEAPEIPSELEGKIRFQGANTNREGKPVLYEFIIEEEGKARKANFSVKPGESIAEVYEKTKAKFETPKPPVETEKPAARQIREEPLENIDVDRQRFQPRVEGLDTALQEERMKVYDRTKIEENPIIVWRDPKDSRFKVLAGDHRRDLLQRAGEKTAPVIEFIGTEKEAIKRAATENAERAAESILDRANYYHTKIQEGVDLKTLVEEAKGRGEKHTTILAIAHLNPKGKAIEAVKSLQKGDLQSSNRVVEMAEWVGGARRRYPELTDLHEGEMFDFVKTRYGMAGARNKTEFLHRVASVVDQLEEFDKSKPLNLEGYASKSATEKEYENRIEEAKKAYNEAKKIRVEKQEKFLENGVERPRLDELLKPYEDQEKIVEREYRDLLEKRAERLAEVRKSEIDLFAQLDEVTNAELRNAERAGERRTAKEIEDADAVVKTLESEVKAAEDIADAAKQRERAERAKDVVDEEIGKLTKPPEETKAEVPPVQPKEGVTLANLEQGLKPEAKKVVNDAVKGLDDLFEEAVKKVAAGGTERRVPLDEITYQKAKYYFDQAYDALRDTGKTLDDLTGAMAERYGEKIRPYVKRYIDEVQNEFDFRRGQELYESTGERSAFKRPGLRMVRAGDSPKPKETVTTREYPAADDHQRYGANLALDRIEPEGTAFGLFDGTGVGKTITEVLTAIKQSERHGKPALIVAPSKQVIKGSFEEAFNILGIKDRSKVELITYDDLRTGKGGDKEYSVVVFDEAHNLKNVESARSTAATRVKARNQVFATATPMDGPAAASYFMSKITGIPEAKVQERLGYRIEERYDPIKKETQRYAILTQGNSWASVLDHIIDMRNEAIKQGAMTRREFPFYGTFGRVELRLTPEQKLEQQKIDNYWQSKIDASFNPNVKRNYSGQRLGEMSRHLEVLKADNIFENALKDLEAGRSVVVMAEGVNPTAIKALGFKHTDALIPELIRRFEKAGYSIARIFGSGDKAKEVERFQKNEVRVAIATPRSGGTGINLDDVSGKAPRTMYIATANFSGDVFDQILGRTSRRNTQTPSEIKMVYSDAFSDVRRQQIAEAKLNVLRRIQKGEDPDRSALKEKPIDSLEKIVDTIEEPTIKEARAGKKAPGRTVDEPLPVEMERTGERIVKPSEIIADLSKALDVPIRVGKEKFGRFKLGFYKVRPEVVRQKVANDLRVTSHEVAHHLDKKYFGKDPARFDTWKAELKALDYEPKKGRPDEGFAEYMRHFLTLDDAATVAPKFHDYFTKTFLPDHPEIQSALLKAKEDIRVWREESGALGRVIGQIDLSGKAPETGEPKLPFRVKVQTAVTDQLAPIKHVVKEILGEAPESFKLRPSEDPFQVATALAKTAGAKAYEAGHHGGFDFRLNQKVKSLEEIVNPVNRIPGQIEEALAYAYSRHALTLWERGINPGVSKQDAAFVVERFGSERNKTFSKEVTEWSNHLLDYLVEAGGLSAQGAAKMREMYPYYIPLKRAYGESLSQSVQSSAGRGYVDLTSPIKRIKGSGREIINPLESLVQNTEKIIATADKVRVARLLVELGEKVEGTGKWIEQLPPPMEKRLVTLEKLKSQIEKLGGDLSNAELDKIVTIWSNGYSYFGKDNIVSIYRDGKREFYQVQPDLFAALKGLDKPSFHWFISYVMAPPAKAVRLGATGLRAGFSLITNPIRDAQTAFLQGEYGGGRADRIAKALLEEIQGKGGYVREFRRAGGELSGPLGLDRKMVQNAVEDILVNDVKSAAMNVVRHPIEATRRVLSITEAAPRLAEFERVMESYKPKIQKALENGDLVEASKLREDAVVEASNRAAEITVNFRRAGYISQFLNQIIPFFNPAVQGMSVMGRTLAKHPVRSGLKATASLTIPTLGLWWLYKDDEWYQNLPEWERYAFWHIKAGDEIIRLPKPFEWGYVFAGIPEAVAHSVYMKDSRYFKQVLGATLEAANPVDFPAVAKPLVETYFNWDFFRERPIVQRGQELLPAPEQYNSYTSAVAKELGDILKVSPAKIDHLLSGYTGGLARDILNVLPKPIRETADIPVAGRLFVRRTTLGFGGENVQRFYEVFNRVQTVTRTVGEFQKRKDPKIFRHFDKNDIGAYLLRSEANQVNEQLRELRERARRVEDLEMDNEIKSKVVQAIGYAASTITKEYLKNLDEKLKQPEAELMTDLEKEEE